MRTYAGVRVATIDKKWAKHVFYHKAPSLILIDLGHCVKCKEKECNDVPSMTFSF